MSSKIALSLIGGGGGGIKMILGQALSPPFYLEPLDFSPPTLSDRSAVPVRANALDNIQ